jgi:hypothetical protein
VESLCGAGGGLDGVAGAPIRASGGRCSIAAPQSSFTSPPSARDISPERSSRVVPRIIQARQQPSQTNPIARKRRIATSELDNAGWTLPPSAIGAVSPTLHTVSIEAMSWQVREGGWGRRRNSARTETAVCEPVAQAPGERS